MRATFIFFIFILCVPAYADVLPVNFVKYSADDDKVDSSPVIIFESPYSYNKTVNNLQKAISGKNYRLIRVQRVDQGYSENKGEASDLIVYFCNFNLLNSVLKKDKRIGQFLPCRITVIKRGGKVYLMAMNPKIIGSFLNNVKLSKACDQVTKMYRDIMDETTI